MVFLSFIPVIAAGINVTGIVLVFAALGGFGGFAALVGNILSGYRNRQVAKVEDKSVAITELEKAVPGLGDIITEWRDVVAQLQGDLAATRDDLATCRRRVSELEARGNI